MLLAATRSETSARAGLLFFLPTLDQIKFKQKPEKSEQNDSLFRLESKYKDGKVFQTDMALFSFFKSSKKYSRLLKKIQINKRLCFFVN
jgi:hypothetical protein